MQAEVEASKPVTPSKPSRPVSLDTLVSIVSPRYWMAMLAIGVFLGGVVVWSVFGTLDNKVSGDGVLLTGGSVREVHTADAGVVQSYSVSLGTTVQPSQTIAIVKLADDSTVTVTAPAAGEISGLGAAPGQSVRSGDIVATLADPSAPLEMVGTVAADSANALQPGQKVRIIPIGLNSGGLETVAGTVLTISPLPVSTSQLAATVGSEGLAKQLVDSGGGAVKSVTVSMPTTQKTSSGYEVSNAHGDTLQLQFGMQVQFQVITSSEHPIDKVLK